METSDLRASKRQLPSNEFSTPDTMKFQRGRLTGDDGQQLEGRSSSGSWRGLPCAGSFGPGCFGIAPRVAAERQSVAVWTRNTGGRCPFR